MSHLFIYTALHLSCEVIFILPLFGRISVLSDIFYNREPPPLSGTSSSVRLDQLFPEFCTVLVVVLLHRALPSLLSPSHLETQRPLPSFRPPHTVVLTSPTSPYPLVTVRKINPPYLSNVYSRVVSYVLRL